MKKFIFLLILPTFVILQFCSPSKKTTETTVPPAPAVPVGTMSFESSVMPLISSKCAPCHTNGDKALSLYANAKENIDDIVRRVQLNPGEKGFMPHKRDKLSDSAINVLIAWKQEVSAGK